MATGHRTGAALIFDIAQRRCIPYNRMMRYLLCLVSIFFISLAANAAEKITLVEYFPLTLCTDFSPDFQKQLNQTINEEQSALILTCPIPFKGEHESIKHDPGISFCETRSLNYNHYQNLSLGQGTIVIVNGTYDTTNDYPDVFQAALKAGKADKNIIYAPISHDGNTLSVTLPDMHDIGTTKPMDLIFIAYDKANTFPLARETGKFENNSTPDLNTIKQYTFLNGGLEVVKLQQNNIVRHGKILGQWNGNPETISVQIDHVKTDFYAIIGQEYEYGAIRFIATTQN